MKDVFCSHAPVGDIFEQRISCQNNHVKSLHRDQKNLESITRAKQFQRDKACSEPN